MKLASEEDYIRHFGKTRQEIQDEVNSLDICRARRDTFNLMVTDNTNKQQLVDYYDSWEFLREQISVFNDDTENFERLFNSTVVQYINVLFSKRKLKVLDYGCGGGYLGMSVMLKGHEVTFADLPHRFFLFMKERLSINFNTEENTQVKFISLIDDKLITDDTYDYIICSEVLEHVTKPEEVLSMLIDKLNEGGILYLSTFFNDMNGHDPSHLKYNTDLYNHCQTWHSIVAEYGLIPVAFNEGGSLKYWIKPFSSYKKLKNYLFKYS